MTPKQPGLTSVRVLPGRVVYIDGESYTEDEVIRVPVKDAAALVATNTVERITRS